KFLVLSRVLLINLDFADRFILNCYFFFQAEDSIRDRNVTGVQTCAFRSRIACDIQNAVFLFRKSCIRETFESAAKLGELIKVVGSKESCAGKGTEEVSRLLIVWRTLLGTCLAIHKNMHVAVSCFVK